MEDEGNAGEDRLVRLRWGLNGALSARHGDDSFLERRGFCFLGIEDRISGSSS